MTKSQYIINRKLNILELGEQLGNITEACKALGVSRQHYYDIKGAIEESGVDGLLEKARNKPRYGNRVLPEIEAKVLEYSLQYPTHGQRRVANEFKKDGIIISDGGVRGVWLRHGIETIPLRLKRLEKWAAEENNILAESQVEALEQAKAKREAHGEIETFHPGYLLGQDTFYVGHIKGIGKIFQQTAIDTYSNVGFAKVYDHKSALSAADMLNDKVLPFFDEHGIKLLRTLTDRGAEYCGSVEKHSYQLFLHLNDIEHSKTKVRHPQTNGCTEKLNQTILNEFYKIAFRKKRYETLEQIQDDLDDFMKTYNQNRTNQGKRCQGRTPMQTFTDGMPLYQKYVFDNNPYPQQHQKEVNH